MPENFNIGRKFTFESVQQYYNAKMAEFKSVANLPLQDITSEIYASVDTLLSHFKTIAVEINLNKLIIDDGKSWEKIILEIVKTSTETAEQLWKFRDYVFATCMIWMGEFLSAHNTSITIIDGKPRTRPKTFNIENNEFTVIGSQNLTSDIDVTIQGEGAYYIIEILEDVFETFGTRGIPIKRMDLEFYTDFRIAATIFINVNKLIDEKDSTFADEILKLAYVSYFRSTGAASMEDVSPLARELGKKYLENIKLDVVSKKPLDQIITEAWVLWTTETTSNGKIGQLDREKFYAKAKVVDEQAAEIVEKQSIPVACSTKNPPLNKSPLPNASEPTLNKSPRSNAKDRWHKVFMCIQTTTVLRKIILIPEKQNLARAIFLNIAYGNIHRPESYILPSTAVHVVALEQSKKGSASINSTSAYFGISPDIGVSDFTYIASAIEQLGYLEHYHLTETCSMKGVKYVGRMIRALKNSKLLNGTEYSMFEKKTYDEIYESLNALRKAKATSCSIDINKLNSDLLLEITNTTQLGGYRRHKKVTRRRRSRSGRKRRTYGNRR